MSERHYNVDRELAALRRRIEHLERSRQLNRAMIDTGVLRVGHGGNFRIENAAGDNILDASEDVVGIENLRVGQILSQAVPTRGDASDELNIYVDPTNGDDSASGLRADDGSIGWLQSVQVAADMVPDVWHGLCNVFVLDTESVSESVIFKGIQGGGVVYVKPCDSNGDDTGRTNGGPDTGTIDWVGTIHLTGINLPVFTLDNIWIVDDGSEGGGGEDQLGTITCSAADYVEMFGVRVNANNERNNSIYYTNNSTGQVTSSDRLNNATVAAVRARRFSFVNVGSVTGTSVYGLQASSGSRIVANNAYPTGSTANTITDIGGTVTIVGGSTATTGTVDTTQTTTKTQTWTADFARAWGTRYGWREGENVAYQGDYGYGTYRGLFFLPHAAMRAALDGRTIQKVEIYLSRKSKGGNAASVDHDFYLHDYGSQPAGQPSISNQFDGHDLKWGEDGWKTVSNTVGVKLRDGDAKGIAIHKTTRASYSICNANAKVRIKHTG